MAEGKLKGLPPNRPLVDRYGSPYDILCGTYFLIGVKGEDFVSLTNEQIRVHKYLYDNMMVLPAEREPDQGQGRSTSASIVNKPGRER